MFAEAPKPNNRFSWKHVSDIAEMKKTKMKRKQIDSDPSEKGIEKWISWCEVNPFDQKGCRKIESFEA